MADHQVLLMSDKSKIANASEEFVRQEIAVLKVSDKGHTFTSKTWEMRNAVVSIMQTHRLTDKEKFELHMPSQCLKLTGVVLRMNQVPVKNICQIGSLQFYIVDLYGSYEKTKPLLEVPL